MKSRSGHHNDHVTLLITTNYSTGSQDVNVGVVVSTVLCTVHLCVFQRHQLPQRQLQHQKSQQFLVITDSVLHHQRKQQVVMLFFVSTLCYTLSRQGPRLGSLLSSKELNSNFSFGGGGGKKTKNSHLVTHAQGVHKYVINMYTRYNVLPLHLEEVDRKNSTTVISLSLRYVNFVKTFEIWNGLSWPSLVNNAKDEFPASR